MKAKADIFEEVFTRAAFTPYQVDNAFSRFFLSQSKWPTPADIAELVDRDDRPAGLMIEGPAAELDSAMDTTRAAHAAAMTWREHHWSRYWSPAIHDGYASELDKWAVSAFASMYRNGGIDDPTALHPEEWRLEELRQMARERRECHEQYWIEHPRRGTANATSGPIFTLADVGGIER